LTDDAIAHNFELAHNINNSKRPLSLASATRSLFPATLSLVSAIVSLASATRSLAPTRPLEIDGMNSSRLFVSRLLLEEHKATPPVAKKLSELQSGAVAAMVASATLTAAEQVDLATMAASIPWANEADIDRVLAAFIVQSPLPPGKRRRSQQDFSMVHHFLTEGMWTAMLEPSTPADIKLTAILGHLIKLGMRCPTEPTIKWVTSLWLVCSTDPVELGRMSVVDKAVKFRNVKVHFDGIRKRAIDPPEWIGVLPSKPVELLRDYPLVFKTAFPGGASPGPPGVNIEMISGLDMSYSCRGGLRTTQLSCSSSSAPSSASSSSTAIDLQSILMGFVQSMQANQQQMMQLMVHPPAAAPKTLSSFAALEDRSYRQSCPGGTGNALMGFAKSRSGPLFEELPDSPSPRAIAAQAPPAAQGFEAQAAPIAIVAETAPPVAQDLVASKDVSSGIVELFDMLASRKEEAKVTAKEVKAAKAQETKEAKALLAVQDGEDGAAPIAKDVAPTPKKAKGKGKGKPAKAKGKGKGKGKPAKAAVAPPVAPKAAVAPPVAPPVAPKAAVAPPVAPKDLSEADKVKLAKAKLHAQNGKVRKLTPSDGWGCAKCRWRFSGCGQCKGKTFTGFVWNPSMKQ
jgi:hypothetical protein